MFPQAPPSLGTRRECSQNEILPCLIFHMIQMPAEAPVQIPNPQPANVVVPFVDLKAQYATIKNEIDSAIARVIADTAFIMGREVRAFEEAFADYLGARFCIGV